MKKILINGKGSYIGTAFKEYMNEFPNDYQVEELDMIDNLWKEHDFSMYDVVSHVAEIVHMKEKRKNENLGLIANCFGDLVYEG